MNFPSFLNASLPPACREKKGQATQTPSSAIEVMKARQNLHMVIMHGRLEAVVFLVIAI